MVQQKCLLFSPNGGSFPWSFAGGVSFLSTWYSSSQQTLLENCESWWVEWDHHRLMRGHFLGWTPFFISFSFQRVLYATLVLLTSKITSIRGFGNFLLLREFQHTAAKHIHVTIPINQAQRLLIGRKLKERRLRKRLEKSKEKKGPR